MANRSQAAIRVQGLSKYYGPTKALDGVDIEVRPGEFLTLLGSSGSGKSTLLMIIAGFTHATAGGVFLDGRDITNLPPNKRNLGVVFQSYALFPHMTVGENVAYPLRVRGVSKAERDKRIRAALTMVQLAHLADRRIQQLSGGQKQRVALARAIVFEPRVILMDEPLSALDKKLREDMQVELRELHERLAMTTIYVTHDQREALTMSDRVAVMEHGEILQVDTPTMIYGAPSNSFVAGFMGDTALLDLDWSGEGLALAGQPLLHSGKLDRARKHKLVVRPELLRVVTETQDEPDNLFDGTVCNVIFVGDAHLIVIEMPGGKRLSVRRGLHDVMPLPEPGSELRVGLRLADTLVVPEHVR